MTNNSSDSMQPLLDQLEIEIGNIQSRYRLEILLILKKARNPMDFQEILRQMTVVDATSSKLSYHLNELKNSNYIIKENQQYFLTSLGEEFANKLDEISQILESRRAAIMIRTSKYTFEPFDRAKIVQNLIKEANMPLNDAQDVADEAKRRLEAAKVTYLTAPLIREVINAILIERRMEDYRHKLTRLGLPPFDIKNLLEDGRMDSFNDIVTHLGSATIEQFVLLNQLSQKQADLLLSGTCHLSNLQCFSSNPLELILSGKLLITLLNNFFNSAISSYLFTSVQSSKSYYYHFSNNFTTENLNIFQLPIGELVFYFQQFLKLLYDICPSGIAFCNFEEFLSGFFEKYKISDLAIFFDQVFLYNSLSVPIVLHCSLEANYADLNPFLEYYCNSLKHPIQLWSRLPVLQLHVPKTKIKAFFPDDKEKLNLQIKYVLQLIAEHHVNLDQFSLRGAPDAVQVFTPSQINYVIEDPCRFLAGISLETIYINLPKIAMDAKSDEKLFYSILEQKIYNIFDLYERKWELLVKNLRTFHSWNYFEQLFKNDKITLGNKKNFIDYQGNITLICGVSLFGLDDAVYLLTKLNMRDQDQYVEYAGKILYFVQQLLKKQSDAYSNIKFALADPLPHDFIANPQISLKTELDELYANSGKSVYSNFSLYHHFSVKPYSIQKWIQFYDAFLKNFKNLTLECQVDSSFFNNTDNLTGLLKYFFNSSLLRLSLSRKYQGSKSSEYIYTRYLGEYYSIMNSLFLSTQRNILQ